eukprot:5112773-Pleurochrysis_carterae.AAC.3
MDARVNLRTDVNVGLNFGSGRRLWGWVDHGRTGCVLQRGRARLPLAFRSRVVLRKANSTPPCVSWPLPLVNSLGSLRPCIPR